ncbi:DUF2975 domain-containing protein [Pannonibacter phragmitetus]|uniref:DUF2975 domain-containing protein n=1 Tax=Pannonibacter phragmitetus TaxID=121719 RepID=UPI003D2F13E5
MTSGSRVSPSELSNERAFRLQRIQSVSICMKWILTGLVAVTGLLGLLVCLQLLAPWLLGLDPSETVDIGDVNRVILDLSLTQRIGVTLFLLVLLDAMLMMLWRLRQLFTQFAQLDFFSSHTLSCVVQAGWWLVCLGAMDLAFDPVSSVLMTLDLPAGEKQFSLSLEGGQILFLVMGALVLLFGWVMREAALAHEENQQFV